MRNPKMRKQIKREISHDTVFTPSNDHKDKCEFYLVGTMFPLIFRILFPSCALDITVTVFVNAPNLLVSYLISNSPDSPGKIGALE